MSNRLDTNGRRTASLSLDLDNLWAYQMTHGDPGWETYPSYLDVLVPMVLRVLDELGLTITFFIVGQDAALERNGAAIASISAAGHEIGNHSFRHQPWLHRYSRHEIDRELSDAEAAIEAVTGQHPIGFRGPGYSLSSDVLSVLVERGYRYDCSTLPTVIGPLARAYYFRSAKLTSEQRAERSHLFGSAREGLRPVKPYRWQVGSAQLLEIPVTTLPVARIPFHISYVLYAAGVSPQLGRHYFVNALRVCNARNVQPSILLHPLDFLGSDDVDALGFFPGMTMPGVTKRAVVKACLGELADRYDVVTMAGHAARIESTTTALAVKPSARANSSATAPS